MHERNADADVYFMCMLSIFEIGSCYTIKADSFGRKPALNEITPWEDLTSWNHNASSRFQL